MSRPKTFTLDMLNCSSKEELRLAGQKYTYSKITTVKNDILVLTGREARDFYCFGKIQLQKDKTTGEYH